MSHENYNDERPLINPNIPSTHSVHSTRNQLARTGEISRIEVEKNEHSIKALGS